MQTFITRLFALSKTYDPTKCFPKTPHR